MWLVGFLERDPSFLLAAMETDIAAVTLPLPQRVQATNLMDELSNTARKGRCILSGTYFPAIKGSFARDARVLARLRVARVALAVGLFLDRNARLPNGLAELTPELLPSVPLDPFIGDAVRYRRLEKGFVVYSVDQHGRDEGAVSRLPCGSRATRLPATLPSPLRDDMVPRAGRCAFVTR